MVADLTGFTGILKISFLEVHSLLLTSLILPYIVEMLCNYN